ncbi:hypothetical protein SynA15127_02427 [Synechococcus sp. A15-127]|nr:hypothetical protein SynA15127_02427 [Synechococcus sp. A15-127]
MRESHPFDKLRMHHGDDIHPLISRTSTHAPAAARIQYIQAN